MTVGKLLTELEKPENEEQIKHLAHLKHLHNLGEFLKMRGVSGLFARLILAFTRKHMDAFMALAECENAADIAAFKQTKHFAKIKSAEVGEGLSIENLSGLEELQSLNK